jgi:lipid-A-disaccharide synthase
VKELIQEQLTTENAVKELKEILENPDRKLQIQQDYSSLKKLLNQGGHASVNAAKSIYHFLQN